MYDIVRAEQLAVGVLRYTIQARPISSKQNVGQFLLLRVDPYSEWIPLTIADANPVEGTISVVCQVNDRRTDRLSRKWEGDQISDLQIAQSMTVTDQRTGARSFDFHPVGRLSRITRPPSGATQDATVGLSPDLPGERRPLGRLVLPVLAIGFLVFGVAVLVYVGLRFSLGDEPDVVQRGAIRIESSPPGAYINVDGVERSQVTPATVDGMLLDVSHYIKVSKAGHFAEVAEVMLSADSPMKTVTVSLQKHRLAKGMLRVVTEPSGATLFIDGQRQPDTTPCTIAGIGLGVSHRLRVERVGYRRISTEFRVDDAHELLKLPLTLEPIAEKLPPSEPVAEVEQAKPKGGMTITANLPCEVRIDGKVVGRTPLEEAPLDVGEYQLKLVNSQESFEKTYRLTIESGHTVRQHFEFKKASVTFVALPATEIFLGDRKLGQVPMPPISLYEGEYTFRAVDTQLGQEQFVSATVVAGMGNSVDIDFSKPGPETEEE